MRRVVIPPRRDMIVEAIALGKDTARLLIALFGGEPNVMYAELHELKRRKRIARVAGRYVVAGSAQ